MATWMVRAGRGGVYAKTWIDDGIAGIGWDFGETDINSASHEQLKQAYAAAHPDLSSGKIAQAAAQADKFAHQIEQNSTVVTYDPDSRIYHIGKVAGECVSVADIDGITYARKVNWKKAAPRDLLAASSRYSLGSLMTIFNVSAAVAEDLNHAAEAAKEGNPTCSKPIDEASDDSEASDLTFEDGLERIKDRMLSLEWKEMEKLVEGILRAMGYHAQSTEAGADRGRDIIASPDPLGLETPHIVVEVKHRRDTAIGAPLIRSFMGGLRSTDRGLYVSTGGFTREAHYEADRSPVPLRLVNLEQLARLYTEVYDKTDVETRSLLPLAHIWMPA